MRKLLLGLMLLFAFNVSAQSTHTIDFEPAGIGADWAWIMSDNADNPPLEFIANPVSGGINTSATVAKFTARLTGNPWALCFTDDDGEFTFDATNAIVKIMVYKTVVSDVAIKFEGFSGNHQIIIPNTLTDQWEEITFDFSGQIGNTYGRIVIIPDFDMAGRTQENIIYFDNIQVPDGTVAPPAPEPTTVPPIPAHAEENVLSIYTEVYTNLPGTDFNPPWGQSTAVTVDYVAAGNNTLKYENLNYQGTQYTNQDVSGYEYLHVDFWTPNSTNLNFYLISPGAETNYVLPITADTWVSVDIPLTHYVPPVNLSDVFQFKVDGNGTVFFDNWYFWKNPDASPAVTFKVDMSQYGGTFTNVYVSGSFNGWSGDANQLMDPDMDDVYEASIELEDGSYEYKFTLDNWAVQEEFQGGEPCTVTNGGYTNRALEVSGSEELIAVCWNSCNTCEYIPEVYDVTFNVDMNQYPSAFGNVYVSGTLNGWCGDCNQLTDPDLDGIYSITLPLTEGSYEYKFTIDNWTVQENFAGGETCTVTNYGFTNRYLEVYDITVLPEVCWNSCDPCGIIPNIYDVTFQVDMNQYYGGYTNVNINGTFNGWCGGCNVLTDVDMDGVYEITLPLAEGSYEYKFTLDGWDVFEEFAEGDPCTVTNGGFTNRFLELTENTVLPVVCWNSCDACPIYPAGWNGISSNVIPDTKISLEDLFAPIIDDLVVLLGKDGLFWPGQNINTIGDWDTYQGYKVKFSSGVNFEFVGTAPLDLTVALDPGICYIPVLGEGPASVEDVIAPLGDAIEFVFNIKSGEVYWPTGGIVPGVNGALEELTPGFAYLTMVNSACVLDYGIVPPKSGIENSSVSGVSCPAWNNVYSTGMQHIISVAGSNLETGDILGAFDASGHCRGLAQYNGIDAFMPLAVYGDDMTTDMKDGMGVNENMQFKIYRNGTEMDMTAIFDQTLAQHNGRFTENGLSIITELKAGATAINETDAASFNIFPNPGNGLFTITTYGDSNYEISIVDPQGRLVYSSTIKDNTRVDLTNQPKGVYFIRLTGTSSASVQKIVIR